MTTRTRDKQKDERAIDALCKRQAARKAIEQLSDAKALGLSLAEYKELLIRGEV